MARFPSIPHPFHIGQRVKAPLMSRTDTFRVVGLMASMHEGFNVFLFNEETGHYSECGQFHVYPALRG